jgi:hypothetical protein
MFWYLCLIFAIFVVVLFKKFEINISNDMIKLSTNLFRSVD